MRNYSKQFSIVIVLATSIITACNPVSIPLKGKYESNPIEISSTQSIDSAWSRIASLFAAQGLAIKSLDKQKGLLISTKTSFISAYSFEHSNGELDKTQAWVVLQKVFVKEKQWYPKSIYSQWTIQVDETKDGTLIKIDPLVICTYYPNMFTRMEDRGQSTGRFEELIKNSLTKN